MISGPFIVMLCTLAVIANEVILNISHEFVGEPQESYDTIYTTKKYYFMTFFKVNEFLIKIHFCANFAANFRRIFSALTSSVKSTIWNFSRLIRKEKNKRLSATSIIKVS